MRNKLILKNHTKRWFFADEYRLNKKYTSYNGLIELHERLNLIKNMDYLKSKAHLISTKRLMRNQLFHILII